LVSRDETDGDNGVDASTDADGTRGEGRTNGSDNTDDTGNDGRNGVGPPNDGDGTMDEDRTDGSNDADEIDTTVDGSIEGGMLSGVELDSWTVAVVVPFKAPEFFNGTRLFPTWDSEDSFGSDGQ
jgi:hypothetical protein